jgi:hypothetical protein
MNSARFRLRSTVVTLSIVLLGFVVNTGWEAFASANANAQRSLPAASEARTEIAYPQIYATPDGETPSAQLRSH